MSKDETTQPTQRIAIDVDRSPAPPWTGIKFTCAECSGQFRLEAADKCTPTTSTTPGFSAYKTPPCPTPNCGAKAIIVIRIEDQPEGNPS